jgi:hypothetical protein
MPRPLLSAVTAHLPRASSAVTEAPALSLARRALWIAGLLLLVSPFTGAADVSRPPANIVLDEALVNGRRMRLDELRRESERLEDQIYARYNDVNTIDKFDVVCSEYTRTGTRFSGRYCRPVFEEQAKVEEGRVAFEALQMIANDRRLAGSVQLPESPVPKILAQMPDYQRHMRKTMEKDPQLRKLLRERAAVAEQMERTRREMFGK